MVRRTRQKRTRRAKQKSMPSAGNIGEQIFAAVEKLTAGGKMNRSAAIKQVATERKSAPGTVAANYYRMARKKGVKLQRRRRSSSPGRAVSSGRIVAVLQEIAALIKDQARTIAELRKENERFGRLRQVLSRL